MKKTQMIPLLLGLSLIAGTAKAADDIAVGDPVKNAPAQSAGTHHHRHHKHQSASTQAQNPNPSAGGKGGSSK